MGQKYSAGKQGHRLVPGHQEVHGTQIFNKVDTHTSRPGTQIGPRTPGVHGTQMFNGKRHHGMGHKCSTASDTTAKECRNGSIMIEG